MNVNHGQKMSCLIARSRQKGALTIFTAIFVLILMTLMLFYASRVGLFDQRVSSNDTRQKLAFHAAEAGLDYAAEYMLAINTRILSKSAEAQPYLDEDNEVQYYPGWLSGGSNNRWLPCPLISGHTHPCGEGVGGLGSLYYDDPATTVAGQYDALPLDPNLIDNLPPGTEVRVTAVVCPRTLTDPTCLGAAGVPEAGEPPGEPVRFYVWLLAYGYSDCNDDNGDGSVDVKDECRGQANVAVPLGSIENFSGSPTVPLVSKNSLPLQGTAEVVPNPDGGGEGVPLSIWNNARTSECPPLAPGGTEEGDPISVTGAFKTCELEEWYCINSGAVDCSSVPADAKCPGQNASACSCSLTPSMEAISYREGGTPVIGIDVMSDDQFPCDLFEFYFGVPSSQYQTVKANAKVIDDCSVLNESSSGFFWYSDPEGANNPSCDLGNVGTINNPVMLVSASSSLTTINGNAEFFGILYVADVEDPEGDAVFKPGGGAVVYGAAIVDVPFPNSGYSGTFKVVYNEAGVIAAGGLGGLGGIAGGWRDFDLPDIAWE